MVVPLIFLIFYFKFGKDWGDIDDDDVNCEDGYPTWMLVYALIGIFLPCTNFFLVRNVLWPHFHAAEDCAERGDAQGEESDATSKLQAAPLASDYVKPLLIGAKRKQKEATCGLYMLIFSVIAFMGWFIYGVVLMFKSGQKCGHDMYTLLYVVFWISISVFVLISCCTCLVTIFFNELKKHPTPGCVIS